MRRDPERLMKLDPSYPRSSNYSTGEYDSVKLKYSE